MIFNNLSLMFHIHRPSNMASKYLEVRDTLPLQIALESVEINKPNATPNNSPLSGSLTGKKTLFPFTLRLSQCF